MSADRFPIDPLLPDILASLASHPRLVLEAPPGAGKTTRVPPALLDAAWRGDGRILMLEPRRVAARAAAEFMARQRGEEVGQTVGYRIRFDARVSAATRVEVVTEGILTRMLQDDPALEGVAALLFDEFHERHLSGDLGLALALDVQAALRPDLRIVVMSATLDGERLARFLDAPRLSSAGRSHPVEVTHLPALREEPLESQVRRAVLAALAAHPGDVLVFLPGQREIARVRQVLESAGLPGPPPPRAGEGRGGGSSGRNASARPSALAASRDGAGHPAPLPASPRKRGEGQRPHTQGNEQEPTHVRGEEQEPADEKTVEQVLVLPLHGELPVEQQRAALQPDPAGRRRVVLATNVAESSVTLPGVRVVIDSGLAREPRYDPNTGFPRLATVAISQASADQRAGRAGRVAEGWCVRLWPQSQRLEPARRAEIQQVELTGLALELAVWGSSALRFPDPPPPGALAAARDLLLRLGALDGTAPTPLGRRMLALGTHPRLAAMLLAAGDDERALACDLAALVEARDPLRTRRDDLAVRWQALSAWRHGRVAADASRGALAAIERAAREWRRRLRVSAPPSDAVPAHALGDLLAHAFPDRIAHQHAADPRRYQLANGRMLALAADSALLGEPWLVVSELRGGRGHGGDDGLVVRAAPVDEARLRRDFAAAFVTEDRVVWDSASRALRAERQQRFDQIVLDARPAGRVDPARAGEALTEAVRQLGLEVLPRSEALVQWRERVECVRAWQPDLGLPDLSDAGLLARLDAWLAPALAGKTRLDALSEPELRAALEAGIDWAMRQRIEQLAPARITVPSGQQRRITYKAGEPPVLAVKLQELFGLADTPRVCDGRVPLVLHLLSPAGRPLQVTQDLRSFWQRTWPEVRREMKGRYPKHPWPEDPWTAVPTHRAKPRK